MASCRLPSASCLLPSFSCGLPPAVCFLSFRTLRAPPARLLCIRRNPRPYRRSARQTQPAI
ncbi:MAG: hypothetical protein DMF74_04265 [Acidobacteria bacterium]|nr:MAG: hypothetical protein DMF74_04265 [Acidobacteriota bacterium]